MIFRFGGSQCRRLATEAGCGFGLPLLFFPFTLATSLFAFSSAKLSLLVAVVLLGNNNTVLWRDSYRDNLHATTFTCIAKLSGTR